MPKLVFTLSKGMQRSGFAFLNPKAGADSHLVSEWGLDFFGFGYSLHFYKMHALCPFGKFAQTQFEDFIHQECLSAKQSFPGGQHCTLWCFTGQVWICALAFCFTCAWAAVSPSITSTWKLSSEATIAGAGPSFPLPLQICGWLRMPA